MNYLSLLASFADCAESLPFTALAALAGNGFHYSDSTHRVVCSHCGMQPQYTNGHLNQEFTLTTHQNSRCRLIECLAAERLEFDDMISRGPPRSSFEALQIDTVQIDRCASIEAILTQVLQRYTRRNVQPVQQNPLRVESVALENDCTLTSSGSRANLPQELGTVGDASEGHGPNGWLCPWGCPGINYESHCEVCQRSPNEAQSLDLSEILSQVSLSDEEDPIPPPVCSVCKLRQCNMLILPCGHCFCRICVDTQMSLPGACCQFCRELVQGTNPAYFP